MGFLSIAAFPTLFQRPKSMSSSQSFVVGSDPTLLARSTSALPLSRSALALVAVETMRRTLSEAPPMLIPMSPPSLPLCSSVCEGFPYPRSRSAVQAAMAVRPSLSFIRLANRLIASGQCSCASAFISSFSFGRPPGLPDFPLTNGICCYPLF